MLHKLGKQHLVFFAAISLVLTACGEDEASGRGKTFSVDFSGLETVAAKNTRVDKEIHFDGVIEAVNQAVVSAQTSGRIVELPFDVGDFVAKGDVIARFTDTEQKAAFAAAGAGLEEAKARFAEADQQLQRVKDVYERGMVAKANFDQAVASQQAARARVESAQAALDDAKERLSHTVVIAPYSGIVEKRLSDVGATVAPGTPLLEGLSLNHLRVQVDIPQQHIGPLRKHKKARVILASGESIDATTLRIPPSAHVSTHSFRVLVTLPEGELSEPVFPGTLVKVAFVSGEQERLLIPTNAIAKRGEVSAVYVVDKEKELIEFRYIRVGNGIDDQATSVNSGLTEGEIIITDPVTAAAAYKNQTYNN
ncbi:RND family efflux transporter, MFP subunit [Alteromonadaceae bacterium Bs31]|nr:RND family efflux transporter, MFP subunit [Alteromonadaceae bacterium Bs31]